MESRRGEWNDAHSDSKLTPVVLLVRALGKVLRDFPDFNASIGDDGATLVLKDYVHVGVAVDTPSGLLVPVLRDVDKRAFADIVAELAALAEKARTKGLRSEEHTAVQSLMRISYAVFCL